MNSVSLLDLKENDWGQEARATLRDFIRMIVNTRLKINILNAFLRDPYLCLSSDELARRLEESVSNVQRSARELYGDGALHYCSSFGYSDLCSLLFQARPPAIQHCLCLMRLSLRLEPEFVWAQVDSSDSYPHDGLFGV